MEILIYDIMQLSDADSELISPALADVSEETSFSLTIDRMREFDCIGIGNTDASCVTVDGETVYLADTGDYPTSYANGLYLLDETHTASMIEIEHDGSYIGRIGLGMHHTLGAAPSREPGFWSTASNRITLSGAIIPGAGGVSGRQLGMTFTYKFTNDVFKDLALAYPGQMAKNYPFFVSFADEEYYRDYTKDMILGIGDASNYILGDGDSDDLILGNATEYTEKGRFPWARLYGTMEGITDFVLQSSVNRFLYSRAVSLLEAF